MNDKIAKFILGILGFLAIILLAGLTSKAFLNSDYAKQKRMESHYNEGLSYFDSQYYERAKKEFETVIGIDPFSYEAHNSRQELVDILYILGEDDKAEALHEMLPLSEEMWHSKQAERLADNFSEDLPSLFIYFTVLGLLFILVLSYFLGRPASLASIPFLLIMVAIAEFLTVVSFKVPFSPSMYIVYSLHFAFLMWFFRKFLRVESCHTFMLAFGYNIIVEGLPFLIYVYLNIH